MDDESAWELGFYSPGGREYGRYNYLPFGLSSAPGLHDRFSKELLRLLRLNEHITLTDFVDDFLGSAASLDQAWSDLRGAVRFFLDAGVPVSTKEKGLTAPSQVQTWIGWTFDTRRDEISVPPEKIERLRDRIQSAIKANEEKKLRAKELAATVGLASHVAAILVHGRARLVACWKTLGACGVYSMWQRNPDANPTALLF